MDTERLHTINALFVGGTFDDDGGKESKIASLLFDAINIPYTCPYCKDAIMPVRGQVFEVPSTFGESKMKHRQVPMAFTFINGGLFSVLEEELENIKQSKYYVIFWFANVSNDREKIVNQIKEVNQHCILITSKRNDGEKYSLSDIIYHALGLKSNLVVEFSKDDNDRIHGLIIDPLANVFIDRTDDILLLGKGLRKRADELVNFTRWGSYKKGELSETAPVLDDQEFFAIVKHYAEIFHDLIHHHPDATNRFFGNASFRCERGFPSFKGPGKDNFKREIFFVSRRNMDKRFVDKESFVPVGSHELPLGYYGNDKPSVDTPVQLMLHNHFEKIKYMIHSHVYIDGAPMTDHVIPCGAYEEYDDILEKCTDRDAKVIFINLRGHGSIAMAKDLKDLKNIPYIPIPVPNVIEDYVSSEN